MAVFKWIMFWKHLREIASEFWFRFLCNDFSQTLLTLYFSTKPFQLKHSLLWQICYSAKYISLLFITYKKKKKKKSDQSREV